MAEDEVHLPGMDPEGEYEDEYLGEDAAALLGIHHMEEDPIEVDVGTGSTDPATIASNDPPSVGVAAAPSLTPSSAGTGKRKSIVWDFFDEIVVDGVVKAKCRMCSGILSAVSANGTGHLKRHMDSCSAKTDQRARVQARLALSGNGLGNWEYKIDVARTELARLIARLDLPLSIGETDAWQEYIQRAHNPLFKSVSKQTTTRDLEKLFDERRKMLRDHILAGASAVALTSDIWSGNAKEDYITVVAHYVTDDWVLQKKVIGFRLIDCKHTGDNIAERIGAVIQEFGLIDKVFAITLDNASSNSKAMKKLNVLFGGYLGADPVSDDDDAENFLDAIYNLAHQRCVCHIINLIVKSGLKRFKPYLEDLRTAITFLNSSNHRIALFKNLCIAKGIKPRKFGVDMDVRWNSTYLMLQHLCEEPYPGVFKTFINANFGSEDLLTTRHFTIAKQILQFLEVFYESTVILSGVYYPTSPLVMHQLLEIAIHLQAADEDINLYTIVYPMKQKYLKYWKQIPMLFSIAFVLDPRAKMIGLYNTLTLLKDFAGCDYSSYYADVRSELEKLFAKYEKKYGTARVVREQPPSIIGKRKNATWDRIFGGAGSVVQPGVVCNSAMSELSSYLDSDRLTEYDDSFDILLWWKDHKLTFPVLSILARDVLSVPASTVSSESCFSLTGRILEERRRRLLPEHVEMLVCIKDWELGDAREQHSLVTEHKELAERFDKISIVDGAQDAGGVPAPAGVASQGATPSSVQGRGPGASAGRGGRGAAAAAGNRGGRGVAAAGRGQPAAGRGTAAGTGRGTAAARRGASAGVRASGLRGTRRG